jgi:Ran GTPase-activating protein (RanGAP) involved in mRNA processing and transport
MVFVNLDSFFEDRKTRQDIQILSFNGLDFKSIDPNHVVIIENWLKQNPEITTLRFPSDSITVNWLNAFAGVIKNRNIENIIFVPQVESWELASEKISAIADIIANNTNISSIDLSNNKMGRAGSIIARAILNNPNINSFSMAGNNLDMTGGQEFANVIKFHPRLSGFDLSNNWITPEGASAVMEAIGHNHRVARINLGKNNIGIKGIKNLTNSIEQNPNIKSLKLDVVSLNVEVAKTLAAAIKDHPAIQVVSFNGCWISAKVADALASIFKNPNLISISLDNNNLAKSAVSLARAIEGNSNLRLLSLNSNKLKDHGVTKIAQALKHHPAIEQVSLNRNEIGDHGAKEIALMIVSNDSISKIQISGNIFGKKGFKAIAEAIQSKSQSMTEIEICGGKIDFEDKQIIFLPVIQNNRSLTKLVTSPHGQDVTATGAEIDIAIQSNRNFLASAIEKSQQLMPLEREEFETIIAHKVNVRPSESLLDEYSKFMSIRVDGLCFEPLKTISEFAPLCEVVRLIDKYKTSPVINESLNDEIKNQPMVLQQKMQANFNLLGCFMGISRLPACALSNFANRSVRAFDFIFGNQSVTMFFEDNADLFNSIYHSWSSNDNGMLGRIEQIANNGNAVHYVKKYPFILKYLLEDIQPRQFSKWIDHAPEKTTLHADRERRNLINGQASALSII